MIIIIIIIFKNVRGCQSASFGMSSFGSYSDRSLFVDSVIFLFVWESHVRQKIYQGHIWDLEFSEHLL